MSNKAYFEDGHFEVITGYKLCGDEVIFKTESGIYLFCYRYSEIDRSLFAEGPSMIRVPQWFKLNDNLEWEAKLNLFTHISIYEFKE